MDQNLKTILERAAAEGAQDIHIKAGYPPLFRKAGIFTPLSEEMLNKEAIWTMVLSIATFRQVEILKKRLSIDLTAIIPATARFRINVYFQNSCPGMVIRNILLEPPSLKELDIPVTVSRLFTEASGLIVVAGPRGSGKSSTVAACLAAMGSKTSRRVITIEDPVEFILPDGKSEYIQREVAVDVKDYGSGLKAALRQDCDAIFIGELRDSETVTTALAAAETGHLVVSTMATMNVEETLNLLVNNFPAEHQEFALEVISTALKGIICQRLIPVKASGSRRKLALALEVALANDAMRNVIRNGDFAQIYNIIETGSGQGMITFDKSLSQMVRNGIVGLGAAAPLARDPDGFAKNHQNFKLGE